MSVETGKSLVDQLLAKLPDNLRAIAAPALQDPLAIDAITLLGTVADAQSTLDTRLAEIKAKEEGVLADHKRLQDWFTEKQAVLAEYDTIKPEYLKLKGTTVPPTTPPAAPPAGLTLDVVEKMMQERDAGYAGVLALTTQLAVQHSRDFNEVLNVQQIIAHANQHKIPLQEAYQAVHGEKITARDAAAEKARIDKLVEERMAEERKTQLAQPFPLRGSGPELSPLDQLAMPAEQRAQKYTADSAAERYAALTANKTH